MNATRSRFRIWGPRIAAGCLAAATLTSIYAFRVVFARRGEAVLQLVPADALVVGSLDLVPSPEQALTFKQIDDALSRNKIDGKFQNMILDLAAQSKVPNGLAELTTRSFAVAALKSGGKGSDPGMVILMPLSDGSTAQAILSKKGYPEFWKGTKFYKLPHAQADMMAIGDTLVISPSPWVMHEVAQVAAGERQPVTSLPEYQIARSHEPGDANLMIFMSPKLIEQFGGTKQTRGFEWGGVSATVQDDGIAFSSHSHSDVTLDPTVKTWASLAALRPDLTRVLPDGAYGLIAVSQPGKMFDATRAGLDGDAKKGLSKATHQMADKSGIDADRDLIPGLSGDVVIAAYPSVSPEAGVDLLAVFDDRNGADPAALADKFQAFIDKQVRSDKDFGPHWLAKLDRPDMDGYRLSDKVEKEIRKSMSTDGEARDDVLVQHKTVAWAKVNGAVLVASSMDLLNKAADAYEGKGSTLSMDDMMKTATDTSDGSQMLAAFSLSRIANGVKNTMVGSKMEGDDRRGFDQAISTFSGLLRPFAMRGEMSSNGDGSGSMFVPLDYGKLIDFIGSLNGKSGSTAN